MSNIDDLYAEAQTANDRAVKNANSRDSRLLDCNRNTVIHMRIYPDCSESGTLKLGLPYKTFKVKNPIGGGRDIYAGIDPQPITGEEHAFKKWQKELYTQGRKEQANKMWPTERAYVNCYIIDDSENPDNNGKHMVKNYGNIPTDPKRPKAGSPFFKFLQELREEDNIPVSQIYSLGEDGVTIKMTITKGSDKEPPELKYKVATNTDQFDFKGFGKTYKSKECTTLYAQAHPLSEFLDEPKSFDELEKIYHTHILGVGSDNASPSLSNMELNLPQDEDEDDDIPMGNPTQSETKLTKDSEPDEDSDEEFKKLMEGIEG